MRRFDNYSQVSMCATIAIECIFRGHLLAGNSNENYRGPRGRFVSTWKVIKSPYESYRDWTERYGDTFRIKALNGDVIATSNTEIIRAVYAARSSDVGQFAVGTLEPLLGGKSVILSEGDSHRQQRKLLMPSFQGDLIAQQEAIIGNVAEQVAKQWKNGEAIRLMDFTLDVSLEVIIRVVFGIADNQMVAKCKSSIVEFVQAFRPSLAFSRLLQRPLFGLSPWNKFVRAKQRCMDLLQQEIDHRRVSGVRGDDLLSRLLDAKYDDGSRISDGQIRAQLATMLFAGHETTQIAIAWAFSWLARNRTCLQRAFEELNEMGVPSFVRTSKLLEGICHESLRLNPIVPDPVRVLKKPIAVAGHHFPSETNVAMLASVVHNDPGIYREPQKFNPDRWVGKSFKPSEFFPFGGGVRRCIGASLAVLEMKVVIAVWLSKFDFELPAGAPEVEPVHRRNLVVAPLSGVRLVPRIR